MSAQLGIAFGRKTRSKKQAHDLLKEHRAVLIAAGRSCARRLCVANGTTTAREVRAAMDAHGYLAGYAGRDFWLGAVFADSAFEWTGEWRSYRDETRNIHEKASKVWRLSDQATTNARGTT